MTQAAVFKFPAPLTPAQIGATRWQKTRTRITIALGKLLLRLHAPGLIQEIKIVDQLSDQHIIIKALPMSMQLSVNGRDYFFSRFTGKLVGKGMGCCSNQPAYYKPAGTPRSVESPECLGHFGSSER
jgi:hypothetical protein